MTALLMRSALLMMLAGAIGCGQEITTPEPSTGGGDTTVKHHPPPVGGDSGTVIPSLQTGLWMASADPSTIVRFVTEPLGAGGAQPVATAITTPSGALHTLVSVAFDADGSLWVAGNDDSRLLRFAPADLAGSGTRTAATVILPLAGSIDQSTGLAFDREHRLWVANIHNGTLARFDREQLAAGGAVTPAVVLTVGGKPTALAFDASGALWVSDHGAVTISKFAAADLEATATVTPAIVLQAADHSFANPTGLAFDAAGNLWFANSGLASVSVFTPAQLAASAALVPARSITAAGTTLGLPTGLAFDAAGNLWVLGAESVLTRFTPANLAGDDEQPASARFTITGYTAFWGAAFWPRPAGLPLN
jgi:sugar lactone lactonase YvrE